MGINCKYNGKNNENPRLIKLLEEKGFLPVCPEELGGLTTPRLPAEIQGGEGKDVLDGRAKVINVEGEDVTEQFIRGAEETVKLAKNMDVHFAVLKARSPSCGAGDIYDGSFSGRLTKGEGVTTALLKKHGIEVYTEESISEKI